MTWFHLLTYLIISLLTDFHQ